MLTLAIAAALLTASPPAPPISPTELQSCLGVPSLAAPLAAIAAERAKLTSDDWMTACRQARDAEARRRSAIDSILRTGVSPLRGWEGAERYVTLALAAKDTDVAQLFRRAARDQAARGSLTQETQAQFAAGITPLAAQLLRGLISHEAVAVDADNRAWLSKTVARRGWFIRSRDGAAADHAAWLMVQHGDLDRDFQRRMIAVLEPLLEANETDAARFPYLFDRWAAGAGQPQRFGLQGRCEGPGDWRPFPIEDESGVGTRRAKFGIEALAEQVRRSSGRCT